jgi:hypothetical protein
VLNKNETLELLSHMETKRYDTQKNKKFYTVGRVRGKIEENQEHCQEH